MPVSPPGGGDALQSLCLKTALLDHLHQDSKWEEGWAEDPTTGGWPVFSVLKRRGADGPYACTSLPLDAIGAMERLRPYFVKAGVQGADAFNVHFGRATGTHILLVGCGIPSDLVNAMGGWAAKAEDTMHAHYLSLSPADLLEVGRQKIREARHARGLACLFCCAPAAAPVGAT